MSNNIIVPNYKKSTGNIYNGGFLAYKSKPYKDIEGIYIKNKNKLQPIWPPISVQQVMKTFSEQYSFRTGNCIWIQDGIDKFILIHADNNIYTSVDGLTWEKVIPTIIRNDLTPEDIASGIDPNMTEFSSTEGGGMTYDYTQHRLFWISGTGIDFDFASKYYIDQEGGYIYEYDVKNNKLYVNSIWDTATINKLPTNMQLYMTGYKRKNTVYPLFTNESCKKNPYMLSINKYAWFKFQQPIQNQYQGSIELYDTETAAVPSMIIGTGLNKAIDQDYWIYNSLYDGKPNSGIMMLCIWRRTGSSNGFNNYENTWYRVKFNVKPFGELNIPDITKLYL